MNVLVVEDDPLQGECLRDYLKNLGFSCDLTLNGEAALSMMGAKKYDALVLDYFMPGLSGSQLLEKIRLLPWLYSVPTLILTAGSDQAVAVIQGEVKSLGPVLLIQKPTDPYNVASVLKTLEQQPLNLHDFPHESQ